MALNEIKVNNSSIVKVKDEPCINDFNLVNSNGIYNEIKKTYRNQVLCYNQTIEAEGENKETIVNLTWQVGLISKLVLKSDGLTVGSLGYSIKILAGTKEIYRNTSSFNGTEDVYIDRNIIGIALNSNLNIYVMSQEGSILEFFWYSLNNDAEDLTPLMYSSSVLNKKVLYYKNNFNNNDSGANLVNYEFEKTGIYFIRVKFASFADSNFLRILNTTDYTVSRLIIRVYYRYQSAQQIEDIKRDEIFLKIFAEKGEVLNAGSNASGSLLIISCEENEFDKKYSFCEINKNDKFTISSFGFNSSNNALISNLIAPEFGSKITISLPSTSDLDNHALSVNPFSFDERKEFLQAEGTINSVSSKRQLSFIAKCPYYCIRFIGENGFFDNDSNYQKFILNTTISYIEREQEEPKRLDFQLVKTATTRYRTELDMTSIRGLSIFLPDGIECVIKIMREDNLDYGSSMDYRVWVGSGYYEIPPVKKIWINFRRYDNADFDNYYTSLMKQIQIWSGKKDITTLKVFDYDRPFGIDAINKYTIFKDAEYNLSPYLRVPFCDVMIDGSILLGSDLRYRDAGDTSQADVCIVRSEDGGITFKDPMILFKNSQLNNYDRRNDCAILVNRCRTSNTYGRVFVFAHKVLTSTHFPEANSLDLVPYFDFLYRYSDDCGKTWSEEYSLKNLWTPETVTMLDGIGRGMTMSDGTLVMPTQIKFPTANKTAVDEDPSQMFSQQTTLLYSKDGGETWTLAESCVPAFTSESNCVEYETGKLMFNIRSYQNARRVFVTPDLGTTWIRYSTDKQLPEPYACQGSFIKLKSGLVETALFGNPRSSGSNNRIHWTIQRTDDYLTYKPIIELYKDYHYGCSCICSDDSGNVFVALENTGNRISFYNLSNYKSVLIS